MSRMAPGDHPHHSPSSGRRTDPHERLLRLLLKMAGPQARIQAATYRPWASATFQGSRHEISLQFSGRAAGTRCSAMAVKAPEAEFKIPGHIVADMSVDGHDMALTADGRPTALLGLSALIIEDW